MPACLPVRAKVPARARAAGASGRLGVQSTAMYAISKTHFVLIGVSTAAGSSSAVVLDPLLVAFELGIYALAALCLRQACARGYARVFGLLAGMLYGLLLEYAAISIFQAYSYGQFLIMLFGSVPLCIGVSWGMIIYIAMETSDRYALPWYLRPILDALLALMIDLSMDAIAIRRGFWAWSKAGPWFGVPLGNFYAWFIVVLGFSLLLRLGRLWWLAGKLSVLGDVAVVAVAVPLSVLGLTALLRPYAVWLADGLAGWLGISALLGGSTLVAVWAARRSRRDQPVDWVALAVTLSFHGFFLGVLLATGIARQLPALLAISLALLAATLGLHAWTSYANSA